MKMKFSSASASSSSSSSTSRSFWFLSCSLVLLIIVVVNHAEVAQASHEYLGRELASLQKSSSSSSIRNQPLYPAYHFRPLRNWINDPNGPMYYKGYYHLFYQYNPKGSIWGNIVWAHSISKDLINWKGLEPAIAPSESEPFDKYGTWSGSATFLKKGYNKPAILYTGITNSTNNHQVQVLALPANPSDPFLRDWVKPAKYNPVITPNPDINATNFRDPTTAWWSNGHWKVSVSGSNKRKRGIAYLYRSKDFKHWVRAKHPLHSAPNTGNWECPDFFPVSTTGEKKGLDTTTATDQLGKIKHVLKISLDKTRYDYYTLGTYDTDKDIYKPDDIYVDGWDGLRFDYGNFYASKTFYDHSKNRRILLGWANESDSTAQDIAKGWAGIHVVPRTIWFDPKTKQILQEPVEELKTLRYGQVKMENQPLSTGKRIEIKGITAYQADVEVVFSLPKSLDKAEPFDPKWTNAQHLCGLKGSNVPGGIGPFGLFTLATQDLEEYTPVFFRIFKSNNKHEHVVLLCSDATSSSLDEETYKPSFAGFVNVDLTNRKLSLRSLIDRSVVESFGAGGKTVITSRVYPTKALLDKAHLYAFNNGKETITVETLSAWSMKRPKMMDNQL